LQFLIDFIKKNVEERVINWSHDGASMAEVASILIPEKTKSHPLSNLLQASLFPSFSTGPSTSLYSACAPPPKIIFLRVLQHLTPFLQVHTLWQSSSPAQTQLG
jgi:hypothetical protein